MELAIEVPMEVPSGRILGALDLRIIQLFALFEVIQYSKEPVTFRSGREVHGYVQAREAITDNQDLLKLLGRKIAELVLQDADVREDKKQQCLLGIPNAGIPLAQAAAMVSWNWQSLESQSIHGTKGRIIFRIMREKRKTGYGTDDGWIEGKSDPENHTYWLVDNAVVDADTKSGAQIRMQEDGYPANPQALVLVDWGFGGVAKMEKAGLSTVVAYTMPDILYVFRRLSLWTPDMVQTLTKDIEANQLVS